MRIMRIGGVVALASAGVLMVGTQFPGMPAGFVPVVQAKSGCSDGSLRGNYGFQINGTIVGLGPIGGVALLPWLHSMEQAISHKQTTSASMASRLSRTVLEAVLTASMQIAPARKLSISRPVKW